MSWIILLAIGVSSALTNATKEAAPATKKAAPASKPDGWQKSRECAARAEKIVTEWPQRTGTSPADWHNHYSPKYNKCFLALYFSQPSKDENGFPSIFLLTALFDAFERSAPIAQTCTLLRGTSDCAGQIAKTMRAALLESYSKALNGRPFSDASADEQEAVRNTIGNPSPTNATWCSIDGQPVDCAKAANYISEHMKN